MQIVRNITDMEGIASELKKSGKTIGFVPTMGYLHEGHTSLIDQCKKEADYVVVSIFVNPLQFGPNEDFDRYPRDEQHDTAVAQEHGVDYLFLPDVHDMYPQKTNIELTVKRRTDVLCGKNRPGHFDGVATVLVKLFHITRADYAYFGLKDAQQVAVVQGMVDDFNFPLSIIPVPTVRESSGLAKSSRNVYLSKSERNQAAHIFKALQQAQHFIIDGNKNPVMIIEEVTKFIKQNTDGSIEYVELLSYPELERVDEINQQIIIAVAVHFEGARLIDNIILDKNGNIPEAYF
ncbi:pantoate--beta-alanine ligase [Gracilibacillus sp. YIM 98692]|uniref:pantoate--beta-alanine ligase n=1 Tax=Gracilibacillus sp. YIM 98692 TaxID=2663532 RepID=UPI0013D5ED7B|nr:pantoate--beta-alanine ligase [Gracilibacillus sp. YIM 98692]